MKFVKASLLDAEEYCIAHGCNSLGVMGAGVALALKTKWPQVLEGYKEAIDVGYDALGSVSFVLVDGKCVANIITQKGISHRRREANYSAVILGMKRIELHTDVTRIAIPKIGCGLGGCDWSVMQMMLEDFEEMTGIEFVVYDI